MVELFGGTAGQGLPANQSEEIIDLRLMGLVNGDFEGPVYGPAALSVGGGRGFASWLWISGSYLWISASYQWIKGGQMRG